MKKNIIKNLLFIAIAIITTACNNDNFESTFNETPSARVEKVMNEYSDLLSSSENGWIIEYYPERNQVYGGFNYAVKFDAAKAAIVSYEGADDITKTESSTYDIIASGGPVLTFNTYNKYMHEFANPSFSEYQAKQGDYEFYLTSKDDNTITIQGIKSGNAMRMIKLDETPEVYLTKVADVKNYINGTSGVIVIDGSNYSVASNNLHLSLSITEDETYDMAYNFTNKGIRLYKPITVDGNEVIEFTLDKDKNQLISLDGNTIIELIKSPIDFSNIYVNLANSTFYSNTFLAAFNTAQTIQAGQFGGAYPLQNIIRFGGANPRLIFDINGPIGAHELKFSGILGDPTGLSIDKGSPSTNWGLLPHFTPMLNLIVDNSPYNTQELAANTYRIESKNDPSFWFIITQ